MDKEYENRMKFGRLVKEINIAVDNNDSEVIIENVDIWKRKLRDCLDNFVEYSEDDLKGRYDGVGD